MARSRWATTPAGQHVQFLRSTLALSWSPLRRLTIGALLPWVTSWIERTRRAALERQRPRRPRAGGARGRLSGALVRAASRAVGDHRAQAPHRLPRDRRQRLRRPRRRSARLRLVGSVRRRHLRLVQRRDDLVLRLVVAALHDARVARLSARHVVRRLAGVSAATVELGRIPARRRPPLGARRHAGQRQRRAQQRRRDRLPDGRLPRQPVARSAGPASSSTRRC